MVIITFHSPFSILHFPLSFLLYKSDLLTLMVWGMPYYQSPSSASSLHSANGFCLQRVFGPVMLGVTPF